MASVWVITDDKVGHINQSLGLAQALLERRPEWSLERFDALDTWSALKTLVSKRLPFVPADSSPQFVIGAGRTTHLNLLAVARATGAKSVVLSSPAYPLGFFNYCLLPRHDNPKLRKNVLATRGAINRMRSAPARSGTGMILIGGPAAHCDWDQDALLEQVKVLIRDPTIRWVVTTSRRTPPQTEAALKALGSDNVLVVPFAETDRNWLQENLPGSERCWVTADSVSMVYEALTAGCRTGVLPVPVTRRSRVVLGCEQLMREGAVGEYIGAESNDRLPAPAEFNEALRGADFILSGARA